MDKLDVILEMEHRGGTERRQALEQIVVKARRLGCDVEVGGGQVGGLNLRYGSIRYAIMDLNCEGEIKLYAQPHPNRPAPEAHHQKINDFIEERDELVTRTFPVGTYSMLESKLEEIPVDTLLEFLDTSINQIQESFYAPHYRLLH